MIKKSHDSRTKRSSNIKISFMSRMACMYIMCFTALLLISNYHETLLYWYIEDNSGQHYRQFHTLKSTGTYLPFKFLFGDNLSFLWFSLICFTILNLNIYKYLSVGICKTCVTVIHIESCYYSCSKWVKLN